MTAGRVALLLGLFAVPAVLLWAGHRLRRGAMVRAAFWGAVIAHTLAWLPTIAAAYPPAAWSPDDVSRGLLGFWSLLLAAPVGAGLGVVVARRRGGRPQASAHGPRT
jgi:hypothetical protein